MIAAKRNSATENVDWAFLAFLIGSVYVKLYVKITAIALYLIYIKAKKYDFRKLNRLNKFYFSMVVVGALSSFIAGSFSVPGYPFGFMLGTFQWIVAGSISYLLYIAAVNIPAERFHNTLQWFFVANAIISLVTLIYLTITAGGFPFWLASEKYGVSTGDYINGLPGDTSFVNAAISSAGIIYFLFRRQYGLLALCTITMLLCTSNVTVIFVVLLLAVILLLESEWRKPAFLVLLLCIGIYPILSPQNLRYMNVVYARETSEDKSIGREELPQIRPHIAVTFIEESDILQINETDGRFRQNDLGSIMKASVMYPYTNNGDNPFIARKEFNNNISNYRIPLHGQQINVSGELDKVKKLAVDSISKERFVALDPYVLQDVMARWYDFNPSTAPVALTTLPGKLYAGLQTTYFLRSSPGNFLLGAGMGNFSSKLAVKMTGLGIQGSHPPQYNYISAAFLQYHFFTILYYLSQHAAEHSVLNTPNSIYNQIAGEYGLAGIVLFLFLYLGYFYKHRKHMKTAKYLLPMVLLFFGMEYWFETLSLSIIFEAIVFKEMINNSHNAG